MQNKNNPAHRDKKRFQTQKSNFTLWNFNSCYAVQASKSHWCIFYVLLVGKLPLTKRMNEFSHISILELSFGKKKYSEGKGIRA